jgi:hypothetical protein
LELQFAFRQKHSDTEKVHRIAKLIRTTSGKQNCSAAFLDITQAFDKVRHPALLFKIRKILPHAYYRALESYLTDRLFQVKFKHEQITIKTEAGVPQGSVLGPILYLIYTSDFLTSDDTTTATFAGDTAILASMKFQATINKIDEWLEKWKIKVNQSKYTHITLFLRNQTCPTVQMGNVAIPQKNEVKYLGMHLDKRLTWENHIKFKRKYLNLKTKQMNWLLGKSTLLMEGKSSYTKQY